MSIQFNADEVFEMAERAEENGAKFYRKAAELQSDKANTEFLLELAVMEDGHLATFGAMRKELPDDMKTSNTFDPYMEATLYLDAMMDSHGGEGTVSAADALTGNESMADILQTAIGLERKSILFYMGIKDMVPDNMGKDKVQAIIDEEKGHVATLAGELKTVKDA